MSRLGFDVFGFMYTCLLQNANSLCHFAAAGKIGTECGTYTVVPGTQQWVGSVYCTDPAQNHNGRLG